MITERYIKCMFNFGLENSMDCIVHGVAKSRTRLSDFHFTFHFVGNRQTVCLSSWTIFHPHPACPEGETDLALGDRASTRGCQRVTSAVCRDSGDVSLWLTLFSPRHPPRSMPLTSSSCWEKCARVCCPSSNCTVLFSFSAG